MNEKLLIIGDVHGCIDNYWKILQKNKGIKSIQLGDFGFKKEHEWHLKNINSELHKICFGNHDDYNFLNSPHSLGNFSFDEENSLFSIRGAFSIDKIYRKENVSWWTNEEMNVNEMQEVVDFYIANKPKIVVSHDCPNMIRKIVFGIFDKTITSNGMQIMLENHKPDLWIFGHHHEHVDKMIEGTRFICLDELESFYL